MYSISVFFCNVAFVSVPQISHPYKTIGLIIWSNKCNKVLTDGSVVFKSLYSLKVAFRALLCSCVFASVNFPEADIIIPRYL
jgi:hypothetical protein